MATFFALRVTAHLGSLIGSGSITGTGSGTDTPIALRHELAQAALAGFHETMWLAAGVAVVGVLFALFLRHAVATLYRPTAATVTPQPAG
jgi:hypothetical protein